NLLDTMLRRQLFRQKGQRGPIETIDPAGAAEIRAALNRAEGQPKGQLVASAREFAKAAQIASRVAADQSAKAEATERDSLIGNIGALTFATLLVAILLSRERRLTLRATRLHAAEMQRLADHDGLTSLLNRRCFDEALQALSETVDGAVEIVVCDVNGLKSINDRFGHHAGDAVLVTAKHDLQRAVGTGGTVYRTGGDEFSVISRPGVRIADLARGAFERDGTIIASVGAATFPTDSPLAREVVRLADNRMYDAKRAIDPTAVARETV
ncbi:MAG: GGDEF domain-containing protein, partial [Solirubrobacteraceae bacterium]|nr:GGDEF domain-containing protein [Solirubrobacteraceae bacterium]